ncbi:type II toxin-antitoxin system RelE/ParE family toxin [Sporosarcina sp. E16_3]|uniref:type II toxin-antitoxin system RelE family toxin n=1 Tax=Sporosarcina sp. E16_3 TaxID=2789293 RepID=UPI001A921629|nr:type II toxin-antitoxin system RelE/ParE family toxin [Sporosarcina sp. E16_3]MBO0602001.1 type II toxin-antitoxin system RelE/ParE family toxin [Sporosarcina sp. E16_3]
MKNKFEVVFIEEAKNDYQKLDGSIKRYVDIAIAKMLDRADVLGEELKKKNASNLIGCRKIKFKKIGIRIVYRIIGDKAEIAEIISIGKREENEAYKNAVKRLYKS